MTHFIALVDADAFYCACHRLFEPALRGKPLLVLSNNDGNVVAVSKEGKALGIVRGMPLFQLRETIHAHQIALRSSAYSLYGTLSHRLMEILEMHTSEVEPYSIDEAFLRLDTPYAGLQEEMQALRAKIEQWLGLSVSIGVGPTRALAKLATRLAKQHPDGVYCLSPIAAERESLLAGCPTHAIWGVGPASAKKLGDAGIRTALQFAQAPDQWIRRVLHVPGLRLAYELRGQQAFPLQCIPAPPRSIHRSQSFGQPITDLCRLKEAVTAYVNRAAHHLRAHHLAATALSVSLSTNRFHPGPQYARQITTTLARPSCSPFELLSAAHMCLEQLFRDGYAYHKVGVLLTDFVAVPPQPLSLWENPASVSKQTHLLTTIDRMNQRYGSNTICIGVASLHPVWERRMAYPSLAYTSRWNELALVYA